MCLYHLAACGYFAESGAEGKALNETTSAWEGEYLSVVSQLFAAFKQLDKESSEKVRGAFACLVSLHDTVLEAAQ